MHVASQTGKGARGRSRPLRTLLLLTVGAMIMAGCSADNSAQGTQGTVAAEQLAPVKSVKVAEIEKVQISEPREQVGDVLASAKVSVVAKTTGDVREVLKARGQQVAPGDVIIVLDDTDVLLQQRQAQLSYQSALQSLESGRKQWQHNVTKLEQALSQATKNYNKMRNDYDAGLVDKAALDQAENAWKNAKDELEMLKENSVEGLELQVRSSELALELSDRALANYRIAAPIGGVLTQLNVEPGMTVGAGTVVSEIQQMDPIKIRALLTAQSADLVRGKTELQFYVPGNDRMYVGQITYLADVIDTQTNTYELNLSVANGDLSLKPGMKVQIRLTEAEEELVVAVPTLSIVREGADHYVFVLNGNRAEKRKIELGRLNGLNQEVLDGVRLGEQLIVSGQHQLVDGEQVEIAK